MKFVPDQLEPEALAASVTRQRLVGEKLEFILYSYQPGSTFATHAHQAEQLTIVLEGQLVFTFEDDGSEVTVNPGEAMLIPSGRAHGAYVRQDAAATRTYNLFSPVRQQLPQG